MSAQVLICVVWATQIALECIRSAHADVHLCGAGHTDRSSEEKGQKTYVAICVVWAKQTILQHVHVEQSLAARLVESSFVWCGPRKRCFSTFQHMRFQKDMAARVCICVVCTTQIAAQQEKNIMQERRGHFAGVDHVNRACRLCRFVFYHNFVCECDGAGTYKNATRKNTNASFKSPLT